MPTVLNIALSKGRILEEGLPLLERAGIRPTENPLTSRKLILDTNLPDVKLTSSVPRMCPPTCNSVPPTSVSRARMC